MEDAVSIDMKGVVANVKKAGFE